MSFPIPTNWNAIPKSLEEATEFLNQANPALMKAELCSLDKDHVVGAVWFFAQKNNFAGVLRGVSLFGRAIYYAGSYCRNYDVALAAIRQDPFALCHVDGHLRLDQRFRAEEKKVLEQFAEKQKALGSNFVSI